MPGTTTSEPVLYDLDRSSASLEYFELAERQVGDLTARRVQLHGITRLHGLWAHRPVLLSGAVFHGRTELDSSRFDGGLSLQGARFGGEWRAPNATVGAFVDLSTQAPPRQVGELAVLGRATVKTAGGSGWRLRPEQPTADQNLGQPIAEPHGRQ